MSYPAAASSVGIASRNENSVAAGRDSPSAYPPRMVAAERDVPGISASTWAHPMPSAWRAEIAAHLGRDRDRAQPLDQQNDDAADDERRRDGHRREEMSLDPVMQHRRPTSAAGRNASNRLPPGAAPASAVKHAPDQVRQHRAIVPDHGEDRADLDHDLEGRGPRPGETEQRSGHDQVPGRRDRQELGDSLDQAEDRRRSAAARRASARHHLLVERFVLRHHDVGGKLPGPGERRFAHPAVDGRVLAADRSRAGPSPRPSRPARAALPRRR